MPEDISSFHTVQYKIEVHGIVQGVWFRKSTKEKAKALNILGYARNQNDGSVLIVANGDVDKLNEFIQFCGTGPSKARVDRIFIEEEHLSEFDGFIIDRS